MLIFLKSTEKDQFFYTQKPIFMLIFFTSY